MIIERRRIGWRDWAAVPLLAVVFSCADDSEELDLPPCTLETGLASHLEGATPTECTTKECVVAEATSGRPFVYREELEGVDSLVSVAFVRSDAGGSIYRIGFDSDPSGGGEVGSRVSQFVCSSLTMNDVCDSRRSNGDCLLCTQEQDNRYALICRGPPGPD